MYTSKQNQAEECKLFLSVCEQLTRRLNNQRQQMIDDKISLIDAERNLCEEYYGERI